MTELSTTSLSNSESARPVRFDLDRYGPRALTSLAAGFVLAQLWLVLHRLYDPDEFEHLHAGFCVWQGMVPYRDFFEQHGPVLWYMSLPLFLVWGASLKVLTGGRCVIWALNAISTALTWRLGNQLYGRWGGAYAAMLLVLMPTYLEKTVEWRPDNVAVPLVLIAALFMTNGRFQKHRWAGWVTGAVLGAAFFCTQKVVYLGFGLLAGLVASLMWDRRARRGPAGDGEEFRFPLRTFLAMAGAALLVAFVFFGFFAAQRAFSDTFENLVLVPLRWQTSEPKLLQIRRSIWLAPVFWSLFASGVVLTLADARQTSFRRAGSLTLSLAALAHLLGLLHVPAVYQQYFLPVTPLAAVLGARAMLEICGNCPAQLTWRFQPIVRWLALSTGAAVVAVACAIHSTSMRLEGDQIYLVWTGLLVGLVARALRYGRLAAGTLLAVVVLNSVPAFMVQYLRWSSEGQVRCIQQLMSATEEQDRFFDGFTGYGALRPHAFHFFWINQHSWPMIPIRQREAGLRAALTDRRTRVVLYDSYLAELLPPHLKNILQNDFALDLDYSQQGVVAVFVRNGHKLPPLTAPPDRSGPLGPADRSAHANQDSTP